MKLIQVGKSIAAGVSFTKNRTVLDRLRPYCNASIKLDYYMEGGTPYPRLEKYPLKLLVTDEMPNAQYDPHKPLRTAAFAGWLVTKAKSKEDLEELAAKLHEELQEVIP